MKFNKGEKVGVLSLVEEVMPKTVNNTNSQVKLDEENQNYLDNENIRKKDKGIDYSIPENR